MTRYDRLVRMLSPGRLYRLGWWQQRDGRRGCTNPLALAEAEESAAAEDGRWDDCATYWIGRWNGQRWVVFRWVRR